MNALAKVLLLVSSLGLLSAPTAAAPAPEDYRVAWRSGSSTVWPPAVLADRLVIARQDKLIALELASGKQLWQQPLPGLLRGQRKIAAIDEVVFALSKRGLQRLDAASGRLLGVTSLEGAQQLLATDKMLYLATASGLIAQDATGQRQLHQVAGLSGRLRGADGTHLAIYQRQAQAKPGQSPKRLLVVEIATGKIAYQFKLLPQGSHQVAQVRAGRLAFIDYSRPAGAGPRRLFYTEADYLRGKKLKDIPLAQELTKATGEQVSLALGKEGRLYFASHGPADAPATLWAYDPQRKRVLWTRSGPLASGGLLWQAGLLWSAAPAAGGQAIALAYNPKNGDTVLRLALPALPRGAPLAAGSAVLFRLPQALVCVAPPAPPQPAQPQAAATTAAPKDWQLYQDRKLGYYIKLPRSWTFDRARMRQLGGRRYVIPFRRRPAPDKPSDGLLQLLTREAAGQDADGVWRAVYAQRQRRSRDIKVHRVRRVRDVGGSGQSGVLASYSYTNRRGQRVKLRSLCLVAHQVAFELRAQVKDAAHWPEVKAILSTFRPHAF